MAVADHRLQTSDYRIQRSRRWGRHGSFSIEYAALIAIVVAALVGMSIVFKRALSGKWRAVGDAFGYGRQYEP